ncbi:MAG: HlyD family efflux transporter periplasmic adaptor subunit [Planctomycetota bacterium]
MSSEKSGEPKPAEPKEDLGPITPTDLPDYMRTAFRRTYVVGRMVIYTSCVFILGLLALMFIARVDETVVARGKVKPRKDVDVYALDAGVLVEVYVQPEDVVKVGAALAKYDDKAARDEMATCEAEIAEARTALAAAEKAVRDELAACKDETDQARASLAAADAKIARLERDPLPEKLKFTDAERKIAQTHLATAEREFQRVAKLFESGIAAKAQYDEAKSKYELAKTESQIAEGKEAIVDQGLAKAILDEAKAERQQITVKIDSLVDRSKRIEEKLKAERERFTVRIDSLLAKSKRTQEKLERTLLRAPAGGQIVLADKDSGDLVKAGVSVKPGDRLFTIATGSEREVHLWVSEDKINKVVGKGLPVRIRSSAFDYQKYGEALGHIDDVALYATEKEGSKMFWVRAVVDESPMPLPFGSSVTAYIVVSRRTLLDMYILNRD